jgi:hypothetical protein
VKSVLRLDSETIVGGILIYIFVVAPATMGHDYNAIMGKVVENAWALALAYVAPLSKGVIETVQKVRGPKHG